MHDHGLLQLVTEATRGENTLDLFLTNNKTLINRLQVIPGISDHDCLLVEGDISPIINKQPKRQIPLYKKADWEGLRKYVTNLWKDMAVDKTLVNTNDLWLRFRVSLEAGINQFIPHKTARSKDSLPWITNELRKLMRKQAKLYLRKKRSGKSSDLNSFKQVKQLIQKKLRQAYWSYVDNLVTPEENDNKFSGFIPLLIRRGMKRFWTYIKHCKKDHTGIAPLRNENGILQDHPEGKAEVLNKQFCSVFTDRVPLSLAQQCSQALDAPPSGEFTSDSDSNIPVMEKFTIGAEGVSKLLGGLKPHKATGPDQIRPLVLRELGTEITPILQFIFQKSLTTGRLPDDWKHANVVPIYKKGPKHIPANYRPVSLTCICSKLLEHIIASQLMSHLDDNKIIYQHQHGFRAKRSCETQLLEFMQDLHSQADKGIQTDAVILDFSKAFDKVSHTRLAYKLNKYGVRGQTLSWIQDFLNIGQCTDSEILAQIEHEGTTWTYLNITFKVIQDH